MTYNCPICHRVVKDLKRHNRNCHRETLEKPQAPTQDITELHNASNGTESTLELDTSGIDVQANASKYHCVDCGAPVTLKTPVCPKCGTALDWESVS